MIDFVSEQFCFREESSRIVIGAVEGDVVLECGACWGATALYFVEKVKSSGHVYSFEFVPENINVIKINMSLNPRKRDRITLVPLAVHRFSDKDIYFTDNGSASVFSFSPFDGYTNIARTISIDDYVERNNIAKVNYITLDVEGSEQEALKGALKTITRFRPKLAISIYHSDDDFIKIPLWLLNLDLGYTVYIKYYTIYSQETVCFASIE